MTNKEGLVLNRYNKVVKPNVESIFLFWSILEVVMYEEYTK